MQMIDKLKREVFESILEKTGRVFILVKYSDQVRVGRRGFSEDEKQSGLVLVFNNQMNFAWNDEGLEGTLLFGGKPEICYVPSEFITLVYSPELGAQFYATAAKDSVEKAPKKISPAPAPTHKTDENAEKETKVIKVDFSKKGA